MIEPSQNLQTIFEQAVVIAKEHNHEYITIEHLMYGIICDPDAYAMIEGFGADANFIKTNLDHYLKNNLKV
jgi:ATP-dependent Clp protease ATP-binding subunit ClpA